MADAKNKNYGVLIIGAIIVIAAIFYFTQQKTSIIGKNKI